MISDLDRTMKSGLGVPHFVQAFAIAQSMFISKVHNSFMFTDDVRQSEYLARKLQKSVRSRDNLDTRSQPKPSAHQKVGFVAERVLESLPDLSLKSYDDILEIKERASDDFERFRGAVAKYASTLKSQPYDDEFQKELDNLITGEVNPSILGLKAKLTTSRHKTLKRVFDKAKDPKAVVPFAVSVVANLSLVQSLLVGAIAAGLDVALESYFEKREIKEANALSFLFNFQ